MVASIAPNSGSSSAAMSASRWHVSRASPRASTSSSSSGSGGTCSTSVSLRAYCCERSSASRLESRSVPERRRWYGASSSESGSSQKQPEPMGRTPACASSLRMK